MAIDLIEQLDLDDPGWPAVVEDLLQELGHGRLGLSAELEVARERLWGLLPVGARGVATRAIARRMLDSLEAPAEQLDWLRAACEDDAAARKRLAFRARGAGPLQALINALARPGHGKAPERLLAASAGMPGDPGGPAAQVRVLLGMLVRMRRKVGRVALGEGRPRSRPQVQASRLEDGWLVAPLIRLGCGAVRVVRRRLTSADDAALGELVIEQLFHSRYHLETGAQLPDPLWLDGEDRRLAESPPAPRQRPGRPLIASIRGLGGPWLGIWHAGSREQWRADMAQGALALGELIRRVLGLG